MHEHGSAQDTEEHNTLFKPVKNLSRQTLIIFCHMGSDIFSIEPQYGSLRHGLELLD